MKGLALIDKNQVAWIEKEPPKVGPLDALCKPLAVCPCTTDIHCISCLPFPHMKGIILGHEAIGKVVEIGSMVTCFKPGDVVVVPAVTPEWDALEVQDGLAKFSNGSGYQFTQKKDGVFAELFHVNHADSNLAHLPEHISLEEGIMAVDMLATACAGVEQVDIRFGDTVVVFGIGPVGLLSIAAARLKGAGKIIALGTKECCIDLAKNYGANQILDYREEGLVSHIFKENGDRPVDKVLIAGGGSDTVSKALQLLKMGGSVSNVAGFVSDEFTVISNDAWFLGTSDKTIHGTMVPGGRRYMERMLSLISNKRIPVKPLALPVLHGFSEIPTALELMKRKTGQIIKPVVIIEENL